MNDSSEQQETLTPRVQAIVSRRCEVCIYTDDAELIVVMKQWVQDAEIGHIELIVTMDHFPVKGEQIALRVNQHINVWVEAETVEAWCNLEGSEFVQESVLIRAIVVEWG